jgi:hypothetical protein
MLFLPHSHLHAPGVRYSISERGSSGHFNDLENIEINFDMVCPGGLSL